MNQAVGCGPVPHGTPSAPAPTGERAEPTSVLRLLHHSLVIAPEAALDSLSTAVAALRTPPGTLTVLAAAPDAAQVLLDRLDEVRQAAGDQEAHTVVLAASGLAAARPGEASPAQWVADALGMPVIAADCRVAVQPDGTLHAVPGAGRTGAPDGGNWWRCAPGSAPSRIGAVWPTSAPDASAAPTDDGGGSTSTTPATGGEPPSASTPVEFSEAFAPTGRADRAPTVAATPGTNTGPAVTALPGGYWIRGDHFAGRQPPGAIGSAAAEPGRTLVVLGLPEQPAVPSADLASAVERLPVTAAPLLSAPWASPLTLVKLGCELSERWGQPVRMAVGLPLSTAEGHASWLLDEAGHPTWQPYLTELTADAERTTVAPSAWRTPAGTGPSRGPATFTAFPGWLVEAVPSGLWLRPISAATAVEVRFRPADPTMAVLTVGETGLPLGEEVWDLVGEFIGDLPGNAQSPWGLVVEGTMVPASEAIGQFLCRTRGLRWLATGGTSTGLLDSDMLGGEDTSRQSPSEEASAGGQLASRSTDAVGAEPPMGSDAGPPAAAPGLLAPAARAQPPGAEPEAAQPAAGGTEAERSAPRAPEAERPAAEQPAAAPDEPAAIDADRNQPGQSPRPPSPGVHPPVLFQPEDFPAPGRPSTAADRAAVQAMVGSRYQRFASMAETAATRLPSLRTGLAEGYRTDLVVVLLHHTDAGAPTSRAELIAAARDGAAGPVAAYLACLRSGLSRLPSHHGAAVLGARMTEAQLALYEPGMVLVEPAPMSALTRPESVLDTPVEFVVWSMTGRRTSLLVEGAAASEVVFPPGTRFAVIDTVPGTEPERPTRVLLRELVAADTAEQSGSARPAAERDEAARGRLLKWLERRDAVEPAQRQTVTVDRFLLTPGVGTTQGIEAEPAEG